MSIVHLIFFLGGYVVTGLFLGRVRGLLNHEGHEGREELKGETPFELAGEDACATQLFGFRRAGCGSNRFLRSELYRNHVSRLRSCRRVPDGDADGVPAGLSNSSTRGFQVPRAAAFGGRLKAKGSGLRWTEGKVCGEGWGGSLLGCSVPAERPVGTHNIGYVPAGLRGGRDGFCLTTKNTKDTKDTECQGARPSDVNWRCRVGWHRWGYSGDGNDRGCERCGRQQFWYQPRRVWLDYFPDRKR